MATAALRVFRFFLAISIFVANVDANEETNVNGPPCPPRCMCFKTTVRCMHLHLPAVPPVPYNTTVLDLRFNRIKTIGPGAFKKLRRLNTLLLNDNQLQTLKDETFQGLSDLKLLYLYKNKIRDISGRALGGMPQLEQLYLHYNKIEKIEPHVFDKMPHLQRLFLHENRLKHIYPGTFEILPSLQRLRIDGNAFLCDCNLKWFKNLLVQRMKDIQITATCQYPEDLQDKPLLSLDFNTLPCNEPRILEGPQDTLVNLGNLAKLVCRVDGDPMPRVTWMLNSNEIDKSNPKYSIQDDGSLIVSSTSENDLGIYQCVAESTYGTTMSDPAKMSGVHEDKRPDFVRRPIDQTAKEGETVQLECSISGPDLLNITWIKDGVPLQSSKSSQSPEGTLTLLDVSLEDSGVYQCTVSLQNGSSMSTPAQLTVNAPPKITNHPENQWVNRGDEVKLNCVAVGNPHPIITWFKDGRSVQPTNKLKLEAESTRIIINHIEDADAGLYTCLAQSIHGTVESNAEIRVRATGPQAPVFTITPYSLVTSLGSAVEFPCKARGDPFPSQEWNKNGEPLQYDSNHKVFPSGSLRLYNVSLEDEGIYECKATNELGAISVEATLRVRGENDVDDTTVFRAFDEAQMTVDRAVNATIAALFHGNITKSSGTLMTLFRYPDATSRAAVRAADIYENTLLNIRRQISAGAQVEPTEDFRYDEILTPHQLQLIANLSGCMEHQIANCSDMCFHSKYRTVDGTCNNMQRPYWGASLTGFKRLLSPIYENGFSQPVGWNRKKLYNGYPLPPARLVSTTIIRTTKITSDTEITHMVMQWGQFLDHDLDHAIPSTTAESWEGLDCKKSCDASPPCFPMEVPHGDNRITQRRCMDFIRSSAICGSGITSVFFNKIMPREQINQLTAYIDGSQVYGFTTNRSILLRDYSTDLGLLRTGITTLSGKPLLPIAGAQEVDCRRDPTESEIGCFLAGDIRVNEQISLAAMHTIWLREHNRIADQLRHVNPHWDGDKIFNEARKIVGAELQHITYKHWMPLILGPEGMELLSSYKGYDPNTNPGISNEFATAAFRFGHTLINPILARLNESFQTIQEGDLPLGKAFFTPWRLVDEGGIDPLMRGMFMSPAKRKRPDENLNDQLTDHLFTSFHAVALDLASMNVQRSRDHGIPFYNDYRKWCGLSSAETFDDLKNEISDQQARDKLRELYGHPGNIDIFVGGILEDQLEGARFGPTFRCIIVDQFKRIRAGDRFWYESPATFSPAQFTQISQSSLARILCDNGDNITRITENVFLLPQVQSKGIIDCRDVPSMDLRFWYECPDCHNDSRSRRDLKHNGTMEDRMDALEEMVKKLQKTIKTLRRKIRSMPSTDFCRDENGKRHSDGASWQLDPCTVCNCQESQVKCTTLQCAPLKCAKTKLDEGRCCPACV